MLRNLLVLTIIGLVSFNLVQSVSNQKPASQELTGLITKIFQGINVTRTEAETAAEDIVKEIEIASGLTNNKFISNIVHNVFSSLNSVIEKAVEIVNDDDSRPKRDLEKNFKNLKDQAITLSSKISSISNIANLPDNLTKMLGGIIGNINIILDNITIRLKVPTNGLKATLQVDSRKREVVPELNSTNTTVATTLTTTNKYQKLAEFYKNKYAGKYLNIADKVAASSTETKRDLNGAMTELQNQVANTSSKILGLTTINRLPNNLAILLTGIFKNINIVLEKIENNVSAIVGGVSLQKRNSKSTADILGNLLKIANRIVEKVSEEISKAADKANEKDGLSKRELEKEESESTTEPITTTDSTTTDDQMTTTTNKYQKLAEFYKNKYAGKYVGKQ